MAKTNISQIRDAMEARCLRPRVKWGQNFLKERGLLELIVREAEVHTGEVVLEIGSGPGCLTEELHRAGARVLAVEIDSDLQQVARDLLGSPEGILWIQGDVLSTKHRLNPVVVDLIREEMARSDRRGFKLVANLPYNVAVPVVVNFLESNLDWRTMVVMVQDELADRFMAPPGTSEYGLVTVLIAHLARIERVRRVGAAAFWPSPKVGSSILKLSPLDSTSFSEVPYSYFKAVSRGIFSHRRKKWLKSLLSGSGFSRKGLLEKQLADLGFDTNLRAESLAPDDILNIAVALSGLGYSATEECRKDCAVQSSRPLPKRRSGQKKL